MAKNIQHIEDMKDRLSETETKIMEVSGNYSVPFTLTTAEALQKVKARIAANPPKLTEPIVEHKSNKIKLLVWSGSIAASILLVLGTWLFYNSRAETKIVAQYGQQLNYQLPDSSEVSLNAGSSIAFSKSNFKTERKLKMEGEAFFKIRKGSKFTINTQNADIQILGTSFNVFARNNAFKVSCVTGKIRVTAGSQKVIITPGESASVRDGKLEKFTEKNIENVANWRIGEFYYENAALTTIFNEIERQYNVTFALPEMKDKYFTGSFSNKNLVDALDIVCIPMGLTYEIGDKGKIYIREKSK
jgi:ferric-dicitrate binding protein FerR (iron transport regulator)